MRALTNTLTALASLPRRTLIQRFAVSALAAGGAGVDPAFADTE